MWWKIILFLWIAGFSTVGLITPISGGLGDAGMFAGLGAEKTIPISFNIVDRSEAAAAENGTGFIVHGDDRYGERAVFLLPSKPADFETAEGYLIDGYYDSETHRINAVSVEGPNPGFSFPFIPGLEERAKIIFFHVPMSWMTVVAFLVSMWYGIRYLRKNDLDDDLKSAHSAGLGLLFCILATTTGSLWAQFNWGSFWNWDPRETSIFVLLLVYGAYFTLRSAIDNEEKKARLSAVYSILAFVTVPFFIFIMPRIMPGLHPGSAGDVNSGPVVSSGGMDGAMRVILYSLLLGFGVMFAWFMSIQNRIQRIILKKQGDLIT
jgi:heme exporter protein C